ncbi:MAG: GNAT family N-acetyltransferase, partial [Oscillospiraceae bacterium]|nr:GNAT family N-acetyltransferase [Oscillospiraceae bacterium]
VTGQIIRLQPEEFHKCAEIWNMERHKEQAEEWRRQLVTGNRTTYIYRSEDRFLGEISMVFAHADPDYSIPGRRLYVSRLVVKPEYRRKGIGRTLVRFIGEKAKELGYRELTIGVDLDNYAALSLYTREGFDRILRVDRDEQGAYLKLLKII